MCAEYMNKDEELIFYAALKLTSPEKRDAYLKDACGDDIQLLNRVKALLNADQEAGDFLKVPVVGPDVTLDHSARIEGPGTTIGRYKLLELIGEGGMGLVYLAEQQEPIRRRVALKIVKLGMDTKQVIARFEAEKQMLALLDHPNIARVYDAGTTETGRPYFVMEYVKGQSITEYCDQHKSSIEDRLKLFRQVCEGVQYAHQKGIIHRDIKPSNILVTVEGDRAVPKIIDFGIAKAVTQSLTGGTLFTQQGQLLGTPEYMSPEQVDMATQDIDTRSDIYSLGVVLYQLLAGVLPFGRESFEKGGFAEIQRVIQEVDPPLPSTALTNLGEEAKKIAERRKTQVVPLARRLHRELEWIPLKAMRKERVRRYRSASELADDIQNYLNGNPLIAGPETAIYRVKKFVRRHAGSVATVILVAAAIILGLVISSAMYFRSEKALQREAIARGQAEQSQKAEQEQRMLAEQQRKLAEQKTEDLRRAMYVNNIQLADAKYKEGNIRRAHELLDSCPNDLRGWEWNRLNYISDQSIMTLRGHKGFVYSATFSPDGRQIVSCGQDGMVKIWDSASGIELMTLRGHEYGVISVAFSPDGKRIISGSADKKIKVWDSESGIELMTLRGHKLGVTSVAFSSDGKQIASGDQYGAVKLWDAQQGTEVMTLRDIRGPEEWIASVAFSPDGKRIISSSSGWDKKFAKIWDATTGNEVMTLNGYSPALYAPDSRFIVSGRDKEIKILDATTGKEMITLHGHAGPIDSIACSPDGKYISSGGMDNTIKVWDIATGKELITFRGHGYIVKSVAFSPDGKRIVSGSWDETIKMWDMTIDRELTKLSGHSSIVFSVAFSPDGKRMVSGSADDTVKLWDVESCSEIMTLRRGRAQQSIYEVAFSPDGKRIAAGASYRALNIWDASTGTELMILRGHEDKVCAVAFSPDSKQIASGSYDNTVKLWDATTSAELLTLRGHNGPVSYVAFSPDSKRIVSGSFDETVKIWDTSTSDELMTLRGHEDIVTSLAFSPDGKQIVSCGQDGMVKIWDSASGAELTTIRGHADDVVSSVSFSPDGRRIITSGRDRTAKVWDATTGAELLVLRADSGVPSVAFSPDNKTIAAGTYDNTILLWESTLPVGGYELRKNGAAARKIVDELYNKHGFYYEVLDKIKEDKEISEPVRKVAINMVQFRVGEDARKIVKELYEKYGYYYDVVDKLQSDVTLNEEVRKLALQIASKLALQIANSRRGEYIKKLTGTSWQFIRFPDRNIEDYRAALDNAQEANRLEPNDPSILLTLGVAQYRMGLYQEALTTLIHSEQMYVKEKLPQYAHVAYIAMTLHKLGRTEEAKTALERLRDLLKKDEGLARFAQSDAGKALLAEVVKLIEGEKK